MITTGNRLYIFRWSIIPQKQFSIIILIIIILKSLNLPCTKVKKHPNPVMTHHIRGHSGKLHTPSVKWSRDPDITSPYAKAEDWSIFFTPTQMKYHTLFYIYIFYKYLCFLILLQKNAFIKMLTGEHKGMVCFANVKIVHTFFKTGSHCFESFERRIKNSTNLFEKFNNWSNTSSCWLR